MKRRINKSDFDSAIKGNEEIRNMRFHAMTFDELEQALETNITEKLGLSQDQAALKLDTIGENSLTEKKGTPWYILFLMEFTKFFSLLLELGAVLTFIAFALAPEDYSNMYLGIVLLIVVLITALFSYYQGAKTAAIMAQFKNFIPPRALVIRDGNESSIEALKLVPGDLIRVKGGENIPADIRVVEWHEMKVNNASLTGESDDLLRKVEKTADNPLETANLAFFGTACTFGNGLGVVINTGDRTVIGQIANLAQSAQTGQTSLAHEIERFVKIICGFAITTGIIFFIIGLIIGYPIVTNFVYAVGIIVANVPEGVLAAVTVSLALTAKRLAKKKVLVKNLESVETLGSTTCICSDKTGTLTQNVMTVSNLWYSGEMRDASVNYQTYLRNKEDYDLEYNINDHGCQELIRTVALGTKAFFEYTPTEEAVKRKIGKILKKNAKKVSKEEFAEHSQAAEQMLQDEEQQKPFQVRKTEGDASESGLIKFIQPIKDLTEIRNLYPIHSYKQKDDTGEETNINCEIPFNSFKKYNLIIRDLAADKSTDSFMLIMKGAPERIWGRCSKILVDGEQREITDYWNKKYEEANAALGKNGERVLAFANIYLKAKDYKRDYHFIMKEEDKNYPMEGLTFIGLVSLNDPPRKYVDQSVAKCRRAGIKVIMVTGDQPVTAAAIAKKVNIITSGSKVNVDMVEQGIDVEQAMEQCDAIVIHGDELARRHAAQENLDDEDPEKGRFIQQWIAKEEVVFARTTPAQKLLIVDACQKSGHVVAVTGDGVNDSPAIKKADIGIAMGSGSDVAKNAADMIILDDDFSSIVNGVEEGRLIFDNLKKAITYLLASNIPELFPFLVYVILQVPLPLTTVMILCIDVGTDMIPAVSYSYENAELDIMLRMPRHSKRDHIANSKVISHGYFQIGIIQAWSGFFTYFVIMNDYGFKPATLIGLIYEKGKLPNSGDVYNPLSSNKGNTKTGGDDTVDWNVDNHNNVDMRLFYYKKPSDSWSQWRWSVDAPNFWRKNVVDNIDICYKIEALRYAQTGFLIGTVCWQWAQLLIVKTRSLSLMHHGFKNSASFYGWLFETILIALIAYIPPLNTALGTRMIASAHFMVLSFPFFSIIFFYDEFRKYYIRRGIDKETSRSTGWFALNTFY